MSHESIEQEITLPNGRVVTLSGAWASEWMDGDPEVRRRILDDVVWMDQRSPDLIPIPRRWWQR